MSLRGWDSEREPRRPGEPEAFELVIPTSLAGERLDRALAVLRPEISRTTFQRWIAEGRVLSEGVPLDASRRVQAGRRVQVRPAPLPPATPVPQNIPLRILYEDEHVAVIDKPAGLVVHPAPGHTDGTLVNALLFRYGAALADDEPHDDAGPPRPGIVHRLDRDTSGVMIIGRTSEAREHLRKLFATHAIERSYLAIVEGLHPARATYDTLHGRHPSDRKRFTTRTRRGKRAVTHVELIEALPGASLVRCRLETGRTHQIRVHLAEHGHPLLGDPLYGRPARDPRVRAAAEQLGRQALHAAVLGLAHPITGEPLHFETPLPEDLARALQTLRTGA